MRIPYLRARRADLAAGAVLFVALFEIFSHTRYGPFEDPKFAYLTAESLLTRQSWDLSPYLPHLAPPRDGARTKRAPRLPYQLRRVDDRLLYIYPPGTPILSLPFVAVMRGMGYSSIDERGLYYSGLEVKAQRLLASLLVATGGLLLFVLARREVPLVPALAVAATAALGTSAWTTASRALWSHTWTFLLAAATLLELHGWEAGRRRRGVWLGVLLVALFWTRPTNAILVVVCTLFVALRHRAALWRTVVTGAVGAAAYALYSASTWMAPVPRYFEQVEDLGQSRTPLGFVVRDLIDTDRGLLVSTPAVLAIVWGLVRRRPRPESRALAAMAAITVVAVFMLYVSGRHFPSGPLGPRYLTDIVPFLAFLGCVAWRARLDDEAARRAPAWRRTAASALLALLILSSYAAQAFWTAQRPAGRAKTRVEKAGTGANPWMSPSQRFATWRWRSLPQVGYVEYNVLKRKPPGRKRKGAGP